MAFARNVSRVLRGEAFGDDLFVVPTALNMIAAGALAVYLTGHLGWGVFAAVTALPLQLLAMAHRPLALGVALVGSLLVGATVTVFISFFLQATALGNARWAAWAIASVLGSGAAVGIGSKYLRSLSELKRADWY